MHAVWIVAIAVGIPVLSGTITRITKLYYTNKEKERNMNLSEEAEALGDIQASMNDLKRRVANLETILLDLENRTP
jgi:predicted  nucleic acid-binding Zn-ribbon protein